MAAVFLAGNTLLASMAALVVTEGLGVPFLLLMRSSTFRDLHHAHDWSIFEPNNPRSVIGSRMVWW